MNDGADGTRRRACAQGYTGRLASSERSPDER